MSEHRGGALASAPTPAGPGTILPPGGAPSLSLIVPVHQGGQAFERCLRALQAALPAPDEMIVVLDGAPDAAAELAREFGARVLRTEVPSGPARARNLGAGAARGDVLFFVDSDVVIPPSAVDEVRRFFREHEDVTALIGTYDDGPEADNFLSQYKNLLHHFVHQNAREEGYTFWGACGAVRRPAFLAVGGFDERYRHSSIEDIELGYRLRAAGHRIRVCKGLQVKHLKRWTPGSLFFCDFFRRALPWTDLILRTGSFENDLNIDRANRAKVALAHGLPAALAAAWWWPHALLAAALGAALLLVLDRKQLRFFRKERGTLFALRTIPWQWFTYWFSGVAFGVGLLRHLLRRRRDGAPVESRREENPAARA